MAQANRRRRRFARLARGPSPIHIELEDGKAHVLGGPPWAAGERTGEVLEGYDDVARGPLARLTPVEPRKILCVGRNYRAHAKELGNDVPVEPMLFHKPTSSLLGPDGTIERPPEAIASRIEHEAELAVVVGKTLRRATAAEALDAIFGVTGACDVTARDLQKKDGQWWRAKGMDTFCPVGPVLVTGLDPQALRVQCRVNGEARQDGTTSDMIFTVANVLAFVSQAMTLVPGDLILTGTPEGVGPLAHGDSVEIEIEEVGVLPLTVVQT